MRKKPFVPLVLGLLGLLLAACSQTPDFTISLHPTTLQIQRPAAGSGPNTGTIALVLTPRNGFSGQVTLALEKQDGSAAPTGITLSPTSVTVSGNDPVGQVLTVNVASNAPTGDHNLRVKATSGNLTKTANFTLKVQ